MQLHRLDCYKFGHSIVAYTDVWEVDMLLVLLIMLYVHLFKILEHHYHTKMPLQVQTLHYGLKLLTMNYTHLIYKGHGHLWIEQS